MSSPKMEEGGLLLPPKVVDWAFRLYGARWNASVMMVLPPLTEIRCCSLLPAFAKQLVCLLSSPGTAVSFGSGHCTATCMAPCQSCQFLHGVCGPQAVGTEVTDGFLSWTVGWGGRAGEMIQGHFSDDLCCLQGRCYHCPVVGTQIS